MLGIKFSKVDDNIGRGNKYNMNIAIDNQNNDLDGMIEDYVQGHMATQGTPTICHQSCQRLSADARVIHDDTISTTAIDVYCTTGTQ